MKIRFVRMLIGWLNRRWPYLVREAVIPQNAHIHLNPTKKVKA